MLQNRKLQQLRVALFLLPLSIAENVYAQGYYDEEPTSETFFFKLITGGFGAFVIIFFGMGGLGSLYMTRRGNSSKSTPMLGVVMLLLAGMTFGYRVMIRAGMMGHEHIQW